MVTDAQHSLFGQRLALTNERSGRGPAYVIVRLPDGRRRSIQITATDLSTSDSSARMPAANVPRVSVRTLIPLAQHLDRILNLLTEEVIRDESASPSASSRCVSTIDPRRQDQLDSGGSPVSVAESVARDSNADSPNIGGTVATDAVDGCGAGKGDGSC